MIKFSQFTLQTSKFLFIQVEYSNNLYNFNTQLSSQVKSKKFTPTQHVCRRRQWQPTAVLLPGKSHGQRSLVGYSPWGCEELDMTERLQFHFSLSCIGEGNDNPLQCSCLENPRDRGAWWAAVYGVSQSQTQLKRLSSSNSIREYEFIITKIFRQRKIQAQMIVNSTKLLRKISINFT